MTMTMIEMLMITSKSLQQILVIIQESFDLFCYPFTQKRREEKQLCCQLVCLMFNETRSVSSIPATRTTTNDGEGTLLLFQEGTMTQRGYLRLPAVTTQSSFTSAPHHHSVFLNRLVFSLGFLQGFTLLGLFLSRRSHPRDINFSSSLPNLAINGRCTPDMCFNEDCSSGE